MAGFIDDNLLPGELVLYRTGVSLRPLLPAGLFLGLLLVPLFGMCAFNGVTIPSPEFWAGVLNPDAKGFVIGMEAALFCWSLIVIKLLWTCLGTDVAATNRRAIVKLGLVSRDVTELQLDKIEGVVVSQGVFGRLLNYGTLTLSGVGTLAISIPHLDDPLAFRRELLALTEQAAKPATPTPDDPDAEPSTDTP